MVFIAVNRCASLAIPSMAIPSSCDRDFKPAKIRKLSVVRAQEIKEKPAINSDKTQVHEVAISQAMPFFFVDRMECSGTIKPPSPAFNRRRAYPRIMKTEPMQKEFSKERKGIPDLSLYALYGGLFWRPGLPTNNVYRAIRNLYPSFQVY